MIDTIHESGFTPVSDSPEVRRRRSRRRRAVVGIIVLFVMIPIGLFVRAAMPLSYDLAKVDPALIAMPAVSEKVEVAYLLDGGSWEFLFTDAAGRQFFYKAQFDPVSRVRPGAKGRECYPAMEMWPGRPSGPGVKVILDDDNLAYLAERVATSKSRPPMKSILWDSDANVAIECITKPGWYLTTKRMVQQPSSIGPWISATWGSYWSDFEYWLTKQ